MIVRSPSRSFIYGAVAASALWFGVTAVMAYDDRLDLADSMLVKARALLQASEARGEAKHHIHKAIKNVDDALEQIEAAKAGG